MLRFAIFTFATELSRFTMTVPLEDPRQTAYQKRMLFKAHLGEFLLPHGFRYCNKCFVRFHEKQLILCVSMDLHHSGAAEIRFGGMPLCAGEFDPDMRLGESLLSFAKIPAADKNSIELQLDLFVQRFEELFVAIEDVRTLLDYQERVLEDRFSAMPVDWAFWESLYLRDYDRARRYAALWNQLLADEAEMQRRQGEAAIRAMDMTNADRTRRLRSFDYRCKVLRHRQYAVQRLMHLLDLGEYGLLQESVQRNIAEATSAFHDAFPEYG